VALASTTRTWHGVLWLAVAFAVCLIAVPSARAAPRNAYVDCRSGNDANEGTTSAHAWRTLERVSATTFTAGAQIRLRAGCSFDGGVTVRGSGSRAAPITLGR